jgi:hypothetical protein
MLCTENTFSTSLFYQVLRKQSWEISKEIILSLEYGNIEKCNVQLPWTALHSGAVDIRIEDVHVIFKLHVKDHADDSSSVIDSLYHKIKMVIGRCIVYCRLLLYLLVSLLY